MQQKHTQQKINLKAKIQNNNVRDEKTTIKSNQVKIKSENFNGSNTMAKKLRDAEKFRN